MDRPVSMKRFDLLYLGAMAVGLVNFALNYRQLAQIAETSMAASGVEGMGGTALVIGVGGGFAISLLLWFLTSRMRLEFMKWVLFLLLAYNLVSLPSAQVEFGQGTVLSIVGLAMQAGAMWFLFRPDSKAWFASKGQ